MSTPRPSLLSPPRPTPLPLRRRLLQRPINRPLPASFASAFRRARFLPVPLSCPRPSTIDTEDSINLGGREGEDVGESEFVEVGYVSGTHGIKGELRLTPSTDFPELRFCEPGRRWLRTRVCGKELISEVQLLSGRGHPGQKSWIVSLGGIDTVEKAKQIVGSTFLVRESDRPDLEEGEFYTRDLVGMRVVLKGSRTLVGIVTNVVNFGASDLLQVLRTNEDRKDQTRSSMLDSSGQHVWVPFVEAIVPEVNMDQGEMVITPPKGLLELNLRSDPRPKKERRQLEWKERKKLQQRLTAAKKKLSEIGQIHVVEGLKVGEKVEKNSLARQIVNIDFKLFQHAIQSINRPFSSFPELMSGNSVSSIRISQDYLTNCGSEEKGDSNFTLHQEGLKLLSKSKAAIALIIDQKDHDRKVFEANDRIQKSSLSQFEDLLLNWNRFWQDMTVPLIVVCPTHLIQPYKECLSNNNYFGMKIDKVWFLEEIQLPIVSMPVNQTGCKILLKSYWELLQAPIGSGGFFKLLLSNNRMAELNEIGIELLQVCSLSDRATTGHPLLLGLVNSHRADVGIKIFENSIEGDEFDMIFSMRYLNKITSQIDKLQFDAVPEQHVHVKHDENGLVTVHPDSPNSYSFRCSVYSSLNICSPDTMCVMKVFE